MSCCNIKVLSYIVGWAHIVFTALVAIGSLAVVCLLQSDYMEKNDIPDDEKTVLTVALIIIMILCCITFPASVMLVVGIKQKRHRLMTFFVWMMYISLGFLTLGVIATFIMQLVHKVSFGNVVLNLLRNCLYVAFEILLFSPIYLLYQKMRSEPVLPEHHGLSNNEPVNKGHYVQGGHM